MFETRWANNHLWRAEPAVQGDRATRLPREAVDKALFLVWDEHCVECAIPECYRSCPLYVRRRDGRCSRFVYGIYPNRDFTGHFDFGADIRFRQWAKLEAALNPTSLPVPVLPHRAQQRFYRLPELLRDVTGHVVDRAGRALGKPTELVFDEFVLECFSPEPDPFRIVIEYFSFPEPDFRQTHYRGSFDIRPGMNFHTVPFERFKIMGREGNVLLYPQSIASGDHGSGSNGAGVVRTPDAAAKPAGSEKRLIFTWLDFIRYTEARRPKQVAARPAAKVKCIAWDLDNTLWQGILAETGDPATLEARAEALELMRALDERGVIQTVVSKNSHDEAWEVLTRLGIQDYFVYPAINWGAKSENLKAVAQRINIDIDTFALIDDSAFERGEVQAALPQVRVYADTEMTGLLSLPELDLPVTEASRTRRLSYLAEMRRETIQASFHGTYDDFIASCEMRLRIFRPSADGELLRCWELVQRSNQLNLSSRRYTLDEFTALVADPAMYGLAFECADRFGDYGIVGFASVADTGRSATLVDFVLSCRVAQKKVEYTFFKWLAEELRGLGKAELLADLAVTKKNKPLRQVFSELPFQVLEDTEARQRLRLDLSEPLAGRNLLAVSADGLQGGRGTA